MLSLDRQNKLREAFRQAHPEWRPATEVFASWVRAELRPGSRVLDLGCGRGGLVEQLDHPLDHVYGLDPDLLSLREHRLAQAAPPLARINGAGDYLPFAPATFDVAFASWVLEHMARPALDFGGLARVLKPGGRLIITFPSDNFTASLGGAFCLERIGLKRVAQGYRRGFNAIARHAHTDPPDRWRQRLEEANLVVEHWQPYFSVRALHALELGHYLGLPSFICHILTRRWVLAPWRSSLYFTEKWLRPLFEERLTDGQEGTMLLFVAQKPEAAGQGNARKPVNRL